jgi:hypothetical protein
MSYLSWCCGNADHGNASWREEVAKGMSVLSLHIDLQLCSRVSCDEFIACIECLQVFCSKLGRDCLNLFPNLVS